MPPLILLHHFGPSKVTGVTVMLEELARLIPASYVSYDALPGVAAVRELVASASTRCVVGVNLHIEVQFELSTELYACCKARGIPAYVYVHDYWPQHREPLALLTQSHGARLLAATPFIAEQLRGAGFDSAIVAVGIPLPPRASRRDGEPFTIGSVGRLVNRKRYPDVVRAFQLAALPPGAQLDLRLLPSQVFASGSDAEVLRGVEDQIAKRPELAGAIRIHRTPQVPVDYSRFSVLVCASSYEGFGMTPIEAAYAGCPPLVSDIPTHLATARALFGSDADAFIFPAGNCEALAALIRDEAATQRRAALLRARSREIGETVRARWSLERTSRALAQLVPG